MGDLNWSSLGLDLVSTPQSISFVSISIHSGLGSHLVLVLVLFTITLVHTLWKHFHYSNFSKEEGSEAANLLSKDNNKQ